MKKFLILLCAIVGATTLSAQLNLQYRSHVEYNVNLNDVWGVEINGREYALVGLTNGVNILDVTDPDNPVDKGTAGGVNSTWRDIKTWDGYAYVTNETGNGVMVINLNNLPNQLGPSDYFNWTPNIIELGGTLDACHNIYIDEFGYGYLVGCNLNNGGPIFIDFFTNPGSPQYIAPGPAIYAHDVYTRDNIMYTSDIYDGDFKIYNVANKNAFLFLGSQKTPSSFTHNAWPSDDGTVLFTTDERANAPVAAYDISDPDNIEELDQFRPISTLGDGVIPHNVHVWNDWVITSYYTDGCIILDGSRPTNLIEVGNFDTFIPASTGFDGVWGAYPFLPSRTVLASDIGNGVYILTPNYVRACWMEGKVTSSFNGDPLNDVEVLIDAPEDNIANTDFQGDYQSGLATAGTYDVTFTKFGFVPQTVSAELDNGVVTELNVQLEPIAVASGRVTSSVDNSPIANANIYITNDNGNDVSTVTNANGEYLIQGFLAGDYDIFVGAWGFESISEVVTLNNSDENDYQLDPGYYDDFALDYNWISTGDATSGFWVRDVPIGTTGGGNPVAPGDDLPNDVGDQCYVTGNGGGNAGTDDVDNGTVTLTSPAMQLESFDNPILKFSYWFANDGGNGTPNDFLQIRVSNGVDEVVLEDFSTSDPRWIETSYTLSNFISISDDVRVTFETSDLPGSGHWTEAGIDGFSVTEALTGNYPPFTSSATSGCAPLEVNFTDDSDSTASWNWTFEGGTPASSTEQNPTVTYNTEGTFDVNLVATTLSGNTYTIFQNNLILVQGLPDGDFTYDLNGATIDFTNTSANATSYVWDFGDGTTSTEASPSHTYSQSGVYTITMTASNDCGSYVVTEEVEIELTGINNIFDNDWTLAAQPNPFVDQIEISYNSEEGFDNATLHLFSIVGQRIESIEVSGNSGSVRLGSDLTKGMYFVQIQQGKQMSRALKIVKLR